MSDATESTAPDATAGASAGGEAPAEATTPAPDATTTAPVEGGEKTAEAPAAVDPLSAKFAALSKREREVALREKREREAIAKERADIEARAKDLETKLAQVTSAEQLLALAKEKPTEFLAKTGLTFKQLTDAVLAEGQEPTADDKIAKLEARLEAEAKARAEAEERAKADAAAREAKVNEEAVERYKAGIQDFVAKNAETYELVAAEGAHELVFDLIEAHYTETAKSGKPEIMTVDKAAELAEAYLLEEATKKFKGSKKIASLFASLAPPPPAQLPVAKLPDPAAAKAPSKAPAKPQITNRGSSVATGAAPEKKPLLTPREIAEKYRRERRRNASA